MHVVSCPLTEGWVMILLFRVLIRVAILLALISPVSVAEWVPTNGPGDSSSVYHLAVSGPYLLAGTEPNGLFLSSDKGASWTHVTNGFPDSGKVTFIKPFGTTLFAGVEHWGNFFYSTDNGHHWQFTGGVINVVGFDSRGSKLFAASNSDGILVSSDSGGIWTFVGNGLPNNDVSSMMADSRNIFVGTGVHGIFISTDDGGSWNPANNNPTFGNIWSFAIIGSNIFAGSYSGGVYRANSSGSNWTLSDSGITNPNVLRLIAAGTNLFAICAYSLSYGGGIFVSTDTGNSWHSANSGLERESVWSLAVMGSELYAGTIKRGVWKRPLSEVISGVMHDIFNAPRVYSLLQNYPNPFNPTTTIRYGLPQRSIVILSVYNTLGQEVATLVNETQGAGYHDVRFDGGGLASGVYLYRLRAGAYSETKRCLLIR